MTELVGAWPAAVGETVAANAWPARLARDGTLHVNAASSTWAFELQQLESEIAGRLREAVPEAAPARLRFAPGPCRSFPRAPLPRSANGLCRSPRSSRRARRTSGPPRSSSEDLRKSVEKAARMSLASVADGRSAC